MRAGPARAAQPHLIRAVRGAARATAAGRGSCWRSSTRGKPLLWVQDRMAILESGRDPSAGARLHRDLIHVEARDARAALWAMEEGLRCSGLCAVIGELWGDPAALDFTATRRLAVAAERQRRALLAGAARRHAQPQRGADALADRERRRALANPLDPRAPGAPAWDAELFRARGHRARPLEHRA